jgi:hypothetical protein
MILARAVGQARATVSGATMSQGRNENDILSDGAESVYLRHDERG